MAEPAIGNYPKLTQICLNAFDAPGAPAALDVMEAMMALEGLPMHCPEHHYIVPAALLTAARRAAGGSREQLAKDLKAAEERAKKVPGGSCGFSGCCGAAVGAGIFAAVWLGTNPKRGDHWGDVNGFTAQCLAHIAQAGGPRCCKRVCYLALQKAVPLARALLGVELGPTPAPRCTRFAQNAECRHRDCPFFPTSQAKEEPQ